MEEMEEIAHSMESQERVEVAVEELVLTAYRVGAVVVVVGLGV